MANRERLDADATLRSVLSTLDDSLTFVRKTFGVVNSYTRTHGPVVLRLGTSKGSKGKWPNYRLDDATTGDFVVVIDGSNHQPWPGNDINLHGDWSTASMTLAEGGTLLLELRALERTNKGVRVP
jgi:hypothetical protein